MQQQQQQQQHTHFSRAEEPNKAALLMEKREIRGRSL